jgi:hypothetical protein
MRADPSSQIHQILESIRLAPQLVRDHLRPARDAGNNRDANSFSLKRFDQLAKGTVAGEQHDLINVIGQFHGIDRKLNVHIAFELTISAGVDKLLGRFGDDCVAVISEPVDKRPDG